MPRARAPNAPATSAADRRNDLSARFEVALSKLGIPIDSKIALAVSGGGDSVALMHLFAAWAKRSKSALPVVLNVDHGLRESSRKESAQVAQWARALGLDAHVLRWNGAKPKTGIEEIARAARYQLLGKWCASHKTAILVTGHTSEDQAETFLMRLGRGSGVDGLSAMSYGAPVPAPGYESVALLRPLLEMSRSELRDYLSAQGIPWLEDPMNEDLQFARTRIRKLLPILEEAGISVARMNEAARHLARARTALDAARDDFLAASMRLEGSDSAFIDGKALCALPREIGLRALAFVLMRVSGASYRPRFSRLESVFDAVLAGSFAARTLCGCRIGKATKAKAVFGACTIAVSREVRSKRPTGNP